MCLKKWIQPLKGDMTMTNAMKHVLFRMFALVLVITMLVTLAACRDTANLPNDSQSEANTTQGGETGETTGASTDSQPVTDTAQPAETAGETTVPSDTQTGASTEAHEAAVTIQKDYVIIYEEDNTNAQNAAEEISKEIFKSCGILLRVYKDSSSEPKETEILIGATSREQSLSLEGLECGWAVGTEDKRCLIHAATKQSFDAAVVYFLSCLEAGDGTVTFKVSDARREVVSDPFASADLTLRVATFNIKNGEGVGHDMAKLAELLIPLELDIVGLQEVDVGTSRVNGLDTLKLLAEAAGYEYYKFAPAIPYKGGHYGTAIMSKYPIAEYETVRLNTPSQYEQRAYGHAVIDVNGCYIHFYNTHLSFENTEVRQDQFAQLNKAINGERGFILTADFNAGPSERQQIESAKQVNFGQYATFPSSGGKIDDIIVHEGWSIVDSKMVSVGSMSDHNLLWAELHFEG